MYLFPERDEGRLSRRLLPAALIVSLFVHFALVGAWGWFGIHAAPLVAKLIPRASPTPEIVALSDAITIEKRTVPRAARRATPQRPPKPRSVAQQPVPRSVPVPERVPVPTLPPIATAAPTSRPTTSPTEAPSYRPVHGTIHHPQAAPTPEPRPRVEAVPEVRTRSGFSRQQIAALDAQFSKTIAQAQRSLANVPPQRRPPARAPDALRYEAIMAGTPEQFLSAQGECAPIQSSAHGPYVYRYLRCLIRYSDGYFEQVSFPWVFRFTRQGDPFQYDDGLPHPFPMQPPPAGFALPAHFALSRAVCSFYQPQCAELIARERANANQAVSDGQ